MHTHAGPDGACPQRRTWRASDSAADGPVVANSRRASSPASAPINAMSVVVHTHMQIDQKTSLLAISVRAPCRRARR
jgi:hypothetical protein